MMSKFESKKGGNKKNEKNQVTGIQCYECNGYGHLKNVSWYITFDLIHTLFEPFLWVDLVDYVF